jgi:hypothetical protein
MPEYKNKNAALILCLLLGFFIMSIPFIIKAQSTRYSSEGSHQTLARQKINWPPVLEQPYPDLTLIDQEGEEFKLSKFKGKVIIVEPIGMNCAACQAFSGGHVYGPFQNNAVQEGLPSFHQLMYRFNKNLVFPNPDIIFIQLLLYDMQLQAPDPSHAQVWAEHFKLRKSENTIVAVSPADMRNNKTFNLIPGFQLIDRNFILRVDSTGHRPQHDLYKELIPAIPALL